MKVYVGILCFIISQGCFAQTWRLLPNSPAATSFRHDDLCFLNEDTGWACNVDGKIYKTTNAGASWETLIDMPNTSFRCIGFMNMQKGWAGNLGPGRWSPTIDTLPLYETKDGGTSWQPVLTINGPLPKGICGINVVNDSVVYAIGRVGGPAYLLKTTNAGASWTSTDMNGIAFQLIDCKFFSPDTGFVVGGYYTSDSLLKYKVLGTTNGGQNWQTVAAGMDDGLSCWKIFFVNRKTGYVSVEADFKSDSVYFLKTTDGGVTWKQHAYYSKNSYGAQGIGFVNDSVGWCAFITGDTRQTVDGGNTWTTNNILNSLNRIRVINPNLAYAVGKRIWKFSLYPTGIAEPDNVKPHGLNIYTYPNPFVDHISIQYKIPAAGKVTIRLYDFSGRPVKTVYEGYDSMGDHQVNVNLNYYFDTHFYVVLTVNELQLTHKIICKK